MAFTLTERTRIRTLLGYGARFFSTQTRLESALDAVGNLAEEVTYIQTILTALTVIDTQLTEARTTVGVEQIDTIHLEGDQGIGHLRAEARRLVESIATILQIPVIKNFYGGGGLTGGAIQYG